MIEIQSLGIEASNKPKPFRLLVSDKQLLETHSKEMYNYLRKNLRYEKKVHIKKDVLLDKNFEQKLQQEQSN